MKKIFYIFLFLAFIGYLFGDDDQMNDNDIYTIENVLGTAVCVIDYDWVNPENGDAISAFKFLNENSKFSYSTTMFGGMSAYGVWTVENPGEVIIKYTSNTQGMNLPDQKITMLSCDRMMVGSTTYYKR